MKSRDLLIVTRRFWPHSGLTEIALGELAINLAEAGHNVTVATIQWSRDWSECIQYHGIPVIRFARPVAGPWSSFRYSRSLARHFTTTSYDGVIVAGMYDEATAVVRTINEFTPALIYVDETHIGSVDDINRKQWENLHSADAVISGSKSVADALSSFESCPVYYFEPGIREREADDVDSIRNGFKKAHQLLGLEPQQPLVVSCTPMNRHSHISDLIAAWPTVLRKYPKAKLWLCGDGKFAGNIWQQIVDLDLTNNILMPGFFDKMIDLFGAANLYVHTANTNQSGDALIRAMVCGTPVLASKNKYTNELISDEQNGLLVEPGNIEALAASILLAIGNRKWQLDAGSVSKNQFVDRYLPSQQVDRYIDLIKSLSDQLVETAQ